ncbi:MAG: hypothetical protein KGJ80_01910 [Chloroflexota bacterium]|nr:hypothetical protein [Chloroflexota bacterium]
MYNRQRPEPRTWRDGLQSLSPNAQLGYGCLIILILGATVMYCAGTISLIARPMLLARSTPTELIHPTLAPTPTQAPPTFMNLPPGTLLATPTQAPIPTREPPTMTPTLDLTNPAPTGSITPRGTPSPSAKPSPTATPTRKATGTLTPHP